MAKHLDGPILRVVAWGVAILALAFWAQVIIGVAVFAVPDRYEAPESIVFSLIAFAIGMSVPAALFWAWRSHIGVRRTRDAAAIELSDSRSQPAEHNASAEPLLEPPTTREIEILRAVAEGKSNKEIAREFIISTGTVKTHTNNLFRKLGASNRTEAVAIARRHGLL